MFNFCPMLPSTPYTHNYSNYNHLETELESTRAPEHQKNSSTMSQVSIINHYCVDCNQKIQEIPKKRVKINFMRCKECYKSSVTIMCQYPCCKQKLRSSFAKYCYAHEVKSKADKKEALARAMEEKRRKKLELPDPFQDSWRFPNQQSEQFNSGVDLFDIYTVLDVCPPYFTQHHVRAAYKRKARELHPDKNLAADSTEQFQHLQLVYKQALALLGVADKE